MLSSLCMTRQHQQQHVLLLLNRYQTRTYHIGIKKRTCELLCPSVVSLYRNQYLKTSYSMSTTTTMKQQQLYMWGTNKSGTILTPSSSSILQNTTTTTSNTTTTTEKNLNVPTLIATLPEENDPTFLSSSVDNNNNNNSTATTNTNTTISKVVCGPTETAIILSNGLCYVSGRNEYGQLGIDKKDPVVIPTCINENFPYFNENDNIVNDKAIVHDVAFGTNFAAYLVVPPNNVENRILPIDKKTKEYIGYDLYTCGFGGSTFAGVGCLGHGDIQHRTIPTLVQSLYEDNVYVQQVVAGEAHCTILTTESEILTTGSGSYGRLGNFDTTDQLYFEPVEITLNTLINVGSSSSSSNNKNEEMKNRIIQIAGGKSFTLALSYDGIIYGWGRNHKGQLGTGLGLAVDMYAMQSVPEPIDTGDLSQKKVIKIAAGHSHAACITESGELYFWGMSLHLEPVLVTSLLHTKIVDVVCGHDYTLAIDMNGHMYSFGSGTNILGHGKDIKHLNEPKLISTLQTGIIDTNDESDKTGKSSTIQRKVVYASAGWQHAACLVEEEKQII